MQYLRRKSNIARLEIILSNRNWNSLQTALPRHPSSYRHLLQQTLPIDHFSIFELSYPVTYPGRRFSYSAFVAGSMGYSDRSHTRQSRPLSRKLNPYRWSVERKVLFSALLPTAKSIAHTRQTLSLSLSVESRNGKRLKSARSYDNPVGRIVGKDLPKPLTKIKTSDIESLRYHC